MPEYGPNEIFKNPRALPQEPDSFKGAQTSARVLSPNDIFNTKLQDPRLLSTYDPVRDMSSLDLMTTGAGKYVADIGHGAYQAAMDMTPGNAGALYAQQEDERKARDKPLMSTDAGKAGYATGAVLANTATGFIPGLRAISLPRTVPQGILSGGVQGALQPRGTQDELGQNIIQGGMLGAGANAIAQAPMRAVNPMSGMLSQEAKDLIGQNVIPTPGQAVDRKTIAGRVMSKLEEAASSIPLLGDFIAHGRGRAVTEFNAAAVARAGGSGAGQDAIDAAHKTLNSAFDNLTSNSRVKLDNTFQVNFSGLTLTDDAKKLLKGKLDDIFTATQNGELTGSAYQKFRGELNAASRNYIRSPLPSDRDIGFALGRIADGLDGAFAAQAPADVQAAWKMARNQWANLKIVEDAAYRGANNNGIFTPNQLTMAMKSAAGTKAQVAGGNARMQDLTDAGSVLSNKLPNSGTIDRGAAGALLGGLGAQYFGYLPEAATAATALYGAYGTRAGAKYMVGAHPWQYPASTLLGVPVPYATQALGTYLREQ